MMVMRELKGGVSVAGMDAVQRGVRGWTRVFGKRKAVPPVLWKSSDRMIRELLLCVGDTALNGQTQLRLLPSSLGVVLCPI